MIKLFFRQSKLRNAVVISRRFNHQTLTRPALVTSIGLTGYLLLDGPLSIVNCAEKINLIKHHEIIRDDLPFYTEEELSRHDNRYNFVKSPGVDTFDVVGTAWEIER